MQYVKLRNHAEMPQEGFGVFQIPENECEEVVYQAIQTGYRLFDTASSYKNEEAVGRAIQRADWSTLTSTLSTCRWEIITAHGGRWKSFIRRRRLARLEYATLTRPG